MNRSFLARAVVAAALSIALTSTAQVAVAAPVLHSAEVRAAAVKRLSATPVPRISGDALIGAVLRAVPGTWRPGHVTLHYRWRSNGRTVTGATSVRFTVRASDAGKAITVSVRATRHGYRSVTRVSKALTIPRSTPPVTSAPAPVSTVPSPVTQPVTPPAPVTNPSPVVTPTAPSTVAISGSGDLRVGAGVAPGTYVTTGSTTLCYWSRVSSFDGQLSSIIANDLGSGQRVITILPTDYGVTFSDCGSWVPVADAPAVSAVRTGEYVVGSQIAAGEYQTTASADGCYWATLSGFTGDLDAIIANDIVDSGTVVVRIPADAAGFETSGCGAWTRIG